MSFPFSCTYIFKISIVKSMVMLIFLEHRRGLQWNELAQKMPTQAHFKDIRVVDNMCSETQIGTSISGLKAL